MSLSLASVEQQAENAGKGFVKAYKVEFDKPKAKQTFRMLPLFTIPELEATGGNMHSVYIGSQFRTKVACIGDGCPACASNDERISKSKPARFWGVSWLFDDASDVENIDGHLIITEMPGQGMALQFQYLQRGFGTLDFQMSQTRSGKGNQTRYPTYPLVPKALRTTLLGEAIAAGDESPQIGNILQGRKVVVIDGKEQVIYDPDPRVKEALLPGLTDAIKDLAVAKANAAKKEGEDYTWDTLRESFMEYAMRFGKQHSVEHIEKVLRGENPWERNEGGSDAEAEAAF